MMQRKYKVLVAHPGKQHSYQSVTALKKAGIDVVYCTTVYDRKNSLTEKLKSLFLKGDDLKRANSRSCSIMKDDEIKQFCELRGLITLFLLRLDKSKKIYRLWNNYVFRCFGRRVAKYAIKNAFDIVIMYDANAKPCFEYLNKKNSSIIKVLDVSIAVRPYQKKVYEDDIKETGLTGLKKEQIFLWNSSYQRYYTAEINNADYFICPSEFVKNSLLYCGCKENSILKVPYGVQLDRFAYSPRESHTGPLRLVMTGQVNYRKGMHHILNVLQRFRDDEVEFSVFGTISDDDYFKRHTDDKKIVYRGFVTQDVIIDTYKTADAYIFPSLCEGLSLSVLEAMASGLPVILSDHSGANDLIEQYANGITFKAGDDDELEACIRWLLNNRERIPAIGKKAFETVQNYSWDIYHENYAAAILNLLNEG